MAFLPNIFGKKPAELPQTGGPATQQKTLANPSASPAAMTAEAAAATPATPATPAAPSHPLDSYASMFKPREATADKPITLADPILSNFDPAEFKQQIHQADFTAAIPPDTLQKAMSGDAKAFAEAINLAAREAFAAAAQLSHGLVEHGSKTAAERVSGSIDSRIRTFQIKTQNTKHEALSHPAVAPMLNAVKLQLATSNPNLTPEQVQQQAEMYFTQMADVLTAPQREAAQAASKPKDPDFSYLLT